MVVGAVGLLMLGSIQPAHTSEVALEALLRDAAAFDGEVVVVTGTMSPVRSRLSRKGVRTYTFYVSDGQQLSPRKLGR